MNFKVSAWILTVAAAGFALSFSCPILSSTSSNLTAQVGGRPPESRLVAQVGGRPPEIIPAV